MNKKIYVDQHLCIACGRCFKYCPKYFDLDDEGLAFITPNNRLELAETEFNKNRDIQKSIVACPTQAIIAQNAKEDD